MEKRRLSFCAYEKPLGEDIVLPAHKRVAAFPMPASIKKGNTMQDKNKLREKVLAELGSLAMSRKNTPAGPALPDINISNGISAIQKVEMSVQEQISQVSKEMRRPVLTMYKTAFFLAGRGMVELMKKEGAL